MVIGLIVTLLFNVPELEEQPRTDDAFQAALVAAIHRFAEDGELDHLRAILDKYPRLVNTKETFGGVRKPYWSDDYTALHRAAERGREEVVGLLIEKGADVDATANNGWTPLHMAAQSGKLSVVKRLVKAGAKVDARTDAVPERFGVPPGSGAEERPRKIPAIPSLTPLEMAKEAKHLEVVEYLEAAGKKP
jgi:ankyrin repeat protein